MNKNIIIVLAGGVLIAILVAVLVQSSLKSSREPVVKEEAKVEVLVAANDLKIGSEVGSGDLEWQDWPEGAVFSGAIVRKDNEKASEMMDGRLVRNIAEGEPVMKSAVVAAEGNYLAASLPKGMRAIAINVKANTMAGGFIGPGDFVDIILTYQNKVKADKDDKLAEQVIDENISKYATETVMENVKVLAVDQAAEREDESDAKVGRTVTLAVSLKEAEKLALCSEMGTLVMVLRSLGDETIIVNKWPVITDLRLAGIDDEVRAEYMKRKFSPPINGGRAASKSANTTGVASSIVRIYNGDEVKDIPVQ